MLIGGLADDAELVRVVEEVVSMGGFDEEFIGGLADEATGALVDSAVVVVDWIIGGRKVVTPQIKKNNNVDNRAPIGAWNCSFFEVMTDRLNDGHEGL